ncbi:MAG: DUF3332 family protein [Leptospirales bacterium]|jgi:hypothetical protein
MQRLIGSILIAVLSFGGVSHCYGSFALTRSLHDAVGSIENRWLRAIVFFLIAAWPLPIVYGLAILADAIVINTVEFWSGDNPMAHRYDSKGEYRASLTEKGARVDFIYRGYGESLEISLLRRGEAEAEAQSMILLRDAPGVVYVREDGRLVAVDVRQLNLGEVTAVQTMQGGRPVATRLLPSKDVEERRRRAFALFAAGSTDDLESAAARGAPE